VRLVVLGAPRSPKVNRWKNDLCEGAESLGWDVTHLPARGVAAEDVIREARSADLMIFARTHGHRPTGNIRAMLRRIEGHGCVTVGLHQDLYWGIPRRQREIGVDPWWSCQHVFTADGGPRPWAKLNVNHRWLPPAAGTMFLGRGSRRREFAHRCVFVGGNVPRIHGRHRAAMLAWARRRYGPGFAWYGRGRQVWGADLRDVYASTEVAVGDSAPSPHYWSNRLPMTLSMGGLLAHPETDGMAGQGFTDEVMVTFPRGRFDVLAAKLDALSESDRRRITDNALDLIASRHLWRHRLEEIAEVVFGAGGHRLRGAIAEVGGPADAAAPLAG
jgi:hypothetical protein